VKKRESEEQLIMSTASPDFPKWYIEFQVALLRQAPRPGEIDQTTALGWKDNQESLKKNLADCLLPQPVATPVEPAKLELLLEAVGTVPISTTTSKFVRDTCRNTAVKISYIGDNFTSWFLSGDDKIEDPISEQTLRCHKLRQFSVDGPIIIELGGAEKSETTLPEMFSLMEKQGKGENGVLLNNGYANIFYIRDIAGVLRTVFVVWYDGGWDVDAHSVESPLRWSDGGQVFSRNPPVGGVLEPSEPLAPAQSVS